MSKRSFLLFFRDFEIRKVSRSYVFLTYKKVLHFFALSGALTWAVPGIVIACLGLSNEAYIINSTYFLLQIRFKGGPPKVQKFSVNEPLSAVRLFAQLNAPSPLSNNFTLMTSFPKKVLRHPGNNDTPQ